MRIKAGGIATQREPQSKTKKPQRLAPLWNLRGKP